MNLAARSWNRGLAAQLCRGILLVACLAPFGGPTVRAEAPCAPACASNCLTAAPPCGTCVEHDLWLVSTRSAPYCGCLTEGVERLQYYHYENGCWTPSDRIGFLAADDPAVTTCFIIHGNQSDACTVRQFALVARKMLARETPCHCRIRVVMWSWPADKVTHRNRDDVNIKSPRSDAQGYYLAWLVDQMNPGVPLSMVGYSLGARTIGGALQILDGGVMAGRSLDNRVHPERRSIRAVYMAAAVDNDWLCPGHCHGRALNQAEHLINLYNPQDPILRFYPLLSRRPRLPDALGYQGKACCSLGENSAKYCQRSVAPWIHNDHDWRDYFSSRGIGVLTAPYVFRAPCEPAKTADPVPAKAPSAVPAK
jgi:hypothetical protein